MIIASRYPPYHDNPLAILEETCIEYNFYRWVVYVLWLQQSDKPFYWFRQIVRKRFRYPHWVISIPTVMVSKKKQVTPAQALLKRYRDPSKPGSLGGVERFAKTWKISNKRAQNLLRKDLAYTLHRPRRRKGVSYLTHSSHESR